MAIDPVVAVVADLGLPGTIGPGWPAGGGVSTGQRLRNLVAPDRGLVVNEVFVIPWGRNSNVDVRPCETLDCGRDSYQLTVTTSVRPSPTSRVHNWAPRLPAVAANAVHPAH